MQKFVYVLAHNFLFLFKGDKGADPHDVLRVDGGMISFCDEDMVCTLIMEVPNPEPSSFQMQVCSNRCVIAVKSSVSIVVFGVSCCI